MNKKYNNRLFNVFLLIGFGLFYFCLIILILFLSIKFNISIEYKITISDFVNIFIALLFTTALPIYVSKVLDRNKSSKELLLYELTKYVEILDSLSNVVLSYSNKNKLNKGKSMIDIYGIDLGNQYNLITDIFKSNNLSFDIFEEKHMNFRMIVTDPMSLTDFSFSENYKKSVVVNKGKLINEIEKIKFDIV